MVVPGPPPQPCTAQQPAPAQQSLPSKAPPLRCTQRRTQHVRHACRQDMSETSLLRRAAPVQVDLRNACTTRTMKMMVLGTWPTELERMEHPLQDNVRTRGWTVAKNLDATMTISWSRRNRPYYRRKKKSLCTSTYTGTNYDGRGPSQARNARAAQRDSSCFASLPRFCMLCVHLLSSFAQVRIALLSQALTTLCALVLEIALRQRTLFRMLKHEA